VTAALAECIPPGTTGAGSARTGGRLISSWRTKNKHTGIAMQRNFVAVLYFIFATLHKCPMPYTILVVYTT
jgi:hypothetical protein